MVRAMAMEATIPAAMAAATAVDTAEVITATGVGIRVVMAGPTTAAGTAGDLPAATVVGIPVVTAEAITVAAMAADIPVVTVEDTPAATEVGTGAVITGGNSLPPPKGFG
jgi:hypothetical protein